MPSVLYIHGFNSSSASLKARQLHACMQRLGLQGCVRVPDLHYDPVIAMSQLETSLAALGQPLLVGSSLGGYYATVLAERYGLKALLVNPAVRPWRLIDAYRGPQKNYYSGEEWVLTDAHVDALAALDVGAPQDPSRYQVWLQTADETLDYRDAQALYQGCALRIEAGGDHGFQNFAEKLPSLLSFAGFSPVLWHGIDFSTFK
ncbi:MULTISPECIES: YqiA/YcfP family alpha/beta fold hydrolase [unclassified Pseudomonas]|uniref:YqiA/YcfP family alpha/beta fold hydrolase n=1 Tax=unclassified Pseudomonas TaxID=196821 RepID=UPI0002FF594E|nr:MULTISPECIES: YqiA/YcfP family alpha/beta fold hydrolase [Pseudomonas]AYN95714.1 alpha/beta fold hydrolase [Pseudomonas sp. LTJR-52]